MTIMQPNMPGAGGFILILIWLLMTAAILGGYIAMLVALWRAMKAHESIARTVADIARHFEKPGAAKQDLDRFTFGE